MSFSGSRRPRGVGIHPVTLRVRAETGKILATWVGRERWFEARDVEVVKVARGGERIRLEGLYVRVSGAAGQQSSLAAQEAELCATSAGELARVFGDWASGLRERRPGLSGLLFAVADWSVTVVRVTLRRRANEAADSRARKSCRTPALDSNRTSIHWRWFPTQ
jgi:putative resolvase